MTFPNRPEYEKLIYQLREVYPEAVSSSTLRLYTTSALTAIMRGEIRLTNGLEIRSLEIINLEKQLAGLLNTDEVITSTDSLMVIPYALNDSSNSFRVQFASQNIQIEQANIDLLKARMKPDFNVGYAAQNYFEGGWLHGLQAGVQIPLFNKQTKQRITAQRLQVDVAQANLEKERLRTQQELLSVKNTIQLYAEGVNFYQEQLDNLNPEMERISELNYQAGEISYLELLNTLNLLSKNNKQYWEQVLSHNKAVVLYQFLSNQ